MRHLEYSWQSSDGLQMFAQEWAPLSKPRALVCLVHGLGEHSGRYAHLGNFLAGAGFALLTFDLRGHGKSEGARGHAPSYDAFMDDITRFLDEVEKRYPGLPRFLYGHSMGGNQILEYVLRMCPSLSGVVCTSPGLRLPFTPPAWKMWLGKLTYLLAPAFSMPSGLEVNALSRDPEVVRQYVADPLVHDRVTSRMALDLLRSGENALERAAEFPLPLLLMHGDADRITSVFASQEFCRKAGAQCTLKIWPGFYHETHNEPEKEQVFSYLLNWLESHLPAGA